MDVPETHIGRRVSVVSVNGRLKRFGRLLGCTLSHLRDRPIVKRLSPGPGIVAFVSRVCRCHQRKHRAEQQGQPPHYLPPLWNDTCTDRFVQIGVYPDVLSTPG